MRIQNTLTQHLSQIHEILHIHHQGEFGTSSSLQTKTRLKSSSRHTCSVHYAWKNMYTTLGKERIPLPPQYTTHIQEQDTRHPALRTGSVD